MNVSSVHNPNFNTYAPNYTAGTLTHPSLHPNVNVRHVHPNIYMSSYTAQSHPLPSTNVPHHLQTLPFHSTALPPLQSSPTPTMMRGMSPMPIIGPSVPPPPTVSRMSTPTHMSHTPFPFVHTSHTTRPRGAHMPMSLQAQDHDVLCGRGVNISHHPGNERFRTLITNYQDASYCTNYSASEKKAVALEIIHHIHNLKPPGRFLKRDVRGSSRQGPRGRDGDWVELTEREAIKKTCQALRDCNRHDRHGYATGLNKPSDVVQQAQDVAETGLSNKERASNAAAKNAIAAAAAAHASLKRTREHLEQQCMIQVQAQQQGLGLSGCSSPYISHVQTHQGSHGHPGNMMHMPMGTVVQGQGPPNNSLSNGGGLPSPPHHPISSFMSRSTLSPPTHVLVNNHNHSGVPATDHAGIVGVGVGGWPPPHYHMHAHNTYPVHVPGPTSSSCTISSNAPPYHFYTPGPGEGLSQEQDSHVHAPPQSMSLSQCQSQPFSISSPIPYGKWPIKKQRTEDTEPLSSESSGVSSNVGSNPPLTQCNDRNISVVTSDLNSDIFKQEYPPVTEEREIAVDVADTGAEVDVRQEPELNWVNQTSMDDPNFEQEGLSEAGVKFDGM